MGVTGLSGCKDISREDANQRVAAALSAIAGVEIIAVDTNSSPKEVIVATWLYPEDLLSLVTALERVARRATTQTTIDLYGPPRYARSTSGDGL